MILVAITRLHDRRMKSFQSQWPFRVEIVLLGRSIRQYDSIAREWLHENCCGSFDLRLDIEAVGFTDESDAVAFALFSAA